MALQCWQSLKDFFYDYLGNSIIICLNSCISLETAAQQINYPGLTTRSPWIPHELESAFLHNFLKPPVLLLEMAACSSFLAFLYRLLDSQFRSVHAALAAFFLNSVRSWVFVLHGTTGQRREHRKFSYRISWMYRPFLLFFGIYYSRPTIHLEDGRLMVPARTFLSYPLAVSVAKVRYLWSVLTPPVFGTTAYRSENIIHRGHLSIHLSMSRIFIKDGSTQWLEIWLKGWKCKPPRRSHLSLLSLAALHYGN